MKGFGLVAGLRRLTACASVLAVAASASVPALADPIDIQTRMIAVPNSPVAMQRCQVKEEYNNITAVFMNVQNRTQHDLLTFDVQYQAFDTDKTLIGSSRVKLTPTAPLASGDVQPYGGGMTIQLSEPISGLQFVTCKLIGATFTGKREWKLGQAWPEKLLPVTAPVTGSAPDAPAQPHAAASSLKVDVANAWNDIPSATPVIYVHDRVVLHGGTSGTTVSPQNFILTMRLASGTDKAYAALDNPAPSTTRATNPGQPVPTVDPKEDLGALRTLSVPAGGKVTVTVTFLVADPVADPTQNRRVAVR